MKDFSKIIFVFLDGVGLGIPDEFNPLYTAEMPFINRLLGLPMTENLMVNEKNLVFKGVDACLNIQGIPQSATGQTSLFTGINAQEILGYHLTAFPNKELREILMENNILKKVKEMGLRSTFANAYDLKAYNKLIENGTIMHSATTVSVHGAEIPFRTIEDLIQRKAVYWDITNETLISRGYSDIKKITPKEAGENLASLTLENEFILFESFMPDIIGHRKNRMKAESFLTIVDSFFEGIIESLNEKTTVIMSSDHGNIEDLTTGAHTKNQVPLFAFGPKAHLFMKANSITDITGIILEAVS